VGAAVDREQVGADRSRAHAGMTHSVGCLLGCRFRLTWSAAPGVYNAQPPGDRPCPCRGLVGWAVEDGVAGDGGCLPGRESAPPVVGLPPADSGDLNRVVPAAVRWPGQVRAADRELPACRRSRSALHCPLGNGGHVDRRTAPDSSRSAKPPEARAPAQIARSERAIWPMATRAKLGRWLHGPVGDLLIAALSEQPRSCSAMPWDVRAFLSSRNPRSVTRAHPSATAKPPTAVRGCGPPARPPARASPRPLAPPGQRCADRPGGAGRAAGPGRPVQPGDRRPAVHQRAHGQVPPAQGLHQARHQLPRPALPGPARRPGHHPVKLIRRPAGVAADAPPGRHGPPGQCSSARHWPLALSAW
jgi:hypothetical protein